MSSARLIETALKGILAEADKELRSPGTGSEGLVGIYATAFGNPMAITALGRPPYDFDTIADLADWFGYFAAFTVAVENLHWGGMKYIGEFLLNTLPGAIGLQPDADRV